ncbi:MAG TPA: diheme cytochrome c [Gallionella sp.]|nr:diheme cytochrome c [Gallionella sp.]
MNRFIALLLLALGMNAAYAEGGKLAVPANAKWQEECSSCHIAYPPKLLTADNWEKMMGGLNKHFGANAELDAKDNKDILEFLKANAGSGERHSAASLRISDTPWFKREHRSVAAKEWVHPEVKSKSNCSACHQNVARGYSERDIRMPGGKRWEEEEDDDD